MAKNAFAPVIRDGRPPVSGAFLLAFQSVLHFYSGQLLQNLSGVGNVSIFLEFTLRSGDHRTPGPVRRR